MLLHEQINDEARDMMRKIRKRHSHKAVVLSAEDVRKFAEMVRDEYLDCAMKSDSEEWRERFVCYANVAETIAEYARLAGASNGH
jgi:flagellar biosynthesis GTPase FlhF